MIMKKNITWGLLLIGIAVYFIAAKLALLPTLPVLSILLTIIFGWGAISGLIKLNFFQGIMSLAILGCIYDKYLHIESITPWALLFAALLISIGLDMIFRHVKKPFRRKHSSHKFAESSTVDTGEHVSCDNSFGSVSKYVNSDNFISGDFENNFGSMNIYFDNAIMATSAAVVNCENNFGEMNLYFPKTWRVQLHQDSAFGDVKYHGAPCLDPNANIITINASSNFGEINIYNN